MAERRLRQIAQHALAREQRAPVAVVAGRLEPVAEARLGEVGGHERDSVERRRDFAQPPQLVGLGRGVVDLEERHARSAKPERASVIAGTEDHDLVRATAQGADDRAVEEPCAHGEKRREPIAVAIAPVTAQLAYETGIDKARIEARLGIGVAGGPRRPVETSAAERHTTGRQRGRVVAHTDDQSTSRAHAPRQALLSPIGVDGVVAPGARSTLSANAVTRPWNTKPLYARGARPSTPAEIGALRPGAITQSW